MSLDKALIELLIKQAIKELEEFKDKLQQPSYFQTLAVPSRINELESTRSLIRAVIFKLKSRAR